MRLWKDPQNKQVAILLVGCCGQVAVSGNNSSTSALVIFGPQGPMRIILPGHI